MTNRSRVIFVHGARRTEVEVPVGLSMMRAATDNLVAGVIGECGGDLSCATCHVYVDQNWMDRVGEPSSEELDMLEATSEEPSEYSRLSCQLLCTTETDGIVLQIPESQ